MSGISVFPFLKIYALSRDFWHAQIILIAKGKAIDPKWVLIFTAIASPNSYCPQSNAVSIYNAHVWPALRNDITAVSMTFCPMSSTENFRKKKILYRKESNEQQVSKKECTMFHDIVSWMKPGQSE